MSRRIHEVQPGFAKRRVPVPEPVVAALRATVDASSLRRTQKAAGVSEATLLEALSGGRLTPPVVARLEAFVAQLAPAPAEEASP